MMAMFFWLYIMLKPLMELVFAVYDQTHLHIKASKAYAKIAILILIDFCKCLPTYYLTHKKHLQYLHEIGFLGTSDLVDSGRLVLFKERDRQGFLKPADHNKKAASGFYGNVSGNPAHLPISSVALDQMWTAMEQLEVKLEDATFIDFGCGTGLALLSAMTKPLRSVVGVDSHEISTIIAQKNIDRFKENDAKVKCTKVSVICEDMINFQGYPDHEGSVTILYMYEPLWTVPKSQAYQIYQKVLSQAGKQSRKLYVVYFYAGRYDGDCLPALAECDSCLLYKEKYTSLFFEPNAEDVYIYEVPCVLQEARSENDCSNDDASYEQKNKSHLLEKSTLKQVVSDVGCNGGPKGAYYGR